MKPVLAHEAWKPEVEQRALPFPSEQGRLPPRAGADIEEDIFLSQSLCSEAYAVICNTHDDQGKSPSLSAPHIFGELLMGLEGSSSS